MVLELSIEKKKRKYCFLDIIKQNPTRNHQNPYLLLSSFHFFQGLLIQVQQKNMNHEDLKQIERQTCLEDSLSFCSSGFWVIGSSKVICGTDSAL
jgi:hypothetical protein